MSAAAGEMTDLVSLTEQLSASASARIGIKPALAAPKIQALLRSMEEGAREGFAKRALLDAEGEELRALVEALLVHETYFFRHPDQLRLFADELLPKWIDGRGDRDELAIWCAGCATGEEVYSVALLVRAATARAPSVRASVLGTDLSETSVAKARRAEYAMAPGLNSFRDVPDFARHHFAAVFARAEETWSPSPEIRRITRFARHNVVADPAPGSFDFVFCRNTLIYFTEAAAVRALASIEGALRPEGALLLGPAEAPREATRLSMRSTAQAIWWTKSAEGA